MTISPDQHERDKIDLITRALMIPRAQRSPFFACGPYCPKCRLAEAKTSIDFERDYPDERLDDALRELTAPGTFNDGPYSAEESFKALISLTRTPHKTEDFKMIDPVQKHPIENTYGAQLVGADFNPSGNPDVDTIKHFTAQLINLIDENGLDSRTVEIAVAHYETAAMYAVKSLTKPPREK